MPDRIMFVQLKTGHDIDRGQAWISTVSFNRSWKTARWHGRTLRRWTGFFDANFYDVETGEKNWLSGPHRDGQDTRYRASSRPSMRTHASRTSGSSRVRRCRAANTAEPPPDQRLPRR